jgi:hypothetical protein
LIEDSALGIIYIVALVVVCIALLWWSRRGRGRVMGDREEQDRGIKEQGAEGREPRQVEPWLVGAPRPLEPWLAVIVSILMLAVIGCWLLVALMMQH